MSIYSESSHADSIHPSYEPIPSHNAEIEHVVQDKLDYRSEIAKFKALVKKDHLDIKPSWSGMIIKEMTTDQLEMYIQTDRVMCILLRAIEKGYLPEFLANNAAILRKYLKASDADYIMHKFSTNGSCTSFDKANQQHVRTIVGSSVDADMEIIIKMLLKNKCLFRYAKRNGLGMTLFVQEFLNVFARTAVLMREKLRMTALEERERETQLKCALRDLNGRKSNIERLNEKLEAQLKETNRKMKEKDELIMQIQLKIGEVNEKFDKKLHDLVNASEKQMMKVADLSETNQNELSQAAKEAQLKYQTLLEEHLHEEKIMRGKRLKIEAQLAMWLDKYDKDIGERQSELDEVMEGYEAERDELIELECLFVEQNKVYSKYKAEKDAEDEEIFQGKLYLFLANRAARRIQRYWRAYRARKLERKRKRRERAKAKAAAKAAKSKK